MSLLVHFVAVCGFLFLFFLSADYTSESDAFVYLEYMCLGAVFVILIHGIQEWVNLEREKRSKNNPSFLQQEYKINLRGRFGKAKRTRKSFLRK